MKSDFYWFVSYLPIDSADILVSYFDSWDELCVFLSEHVGEYTIYLGKFVGDEDGV